MSELETGKLLLELSVPGVLARVYALSTDPPCAYALTWTDGVTQLEDERFTNLSTSLARLALLLECARLGRFFIHSAAGFAVEWRDSVESWSTDG